jgi:hypothetical protein
MLIIRPQPFFFMPGMTAFMPKNVADKLMAMMAFHFSSGKSSIEATNWMPALFTRMSTPPIVVSASAPMAAISAGLLTSAPL